MTMSEINVSHVTPTISRHGGGVASYVWDLARRGKAFGITPQVLAVNDLDTENDIRKYTESINIKTVDRKGPGIIAYAPDLLSVLQDSTVDIIHAHGLRMWPIYGAYKAAKKKQIPFVLSMHGMMTPALLQRNKLKKKIAYVLFDYKTLKNADLIHATSILELQHIRDYGCKNPVLISPIGCDPAPQMSEQVKHEFVEKFPKLKGKRILLYLGLLHHKKGLHRLVEAWAKLENKQDDWHLVIAGPDHMNHLKEVLTTINVTGQSETITLTGPLFGDQKSAAFALAQAFVVHSDWENFGIVIAEALAAKTPVLTSDQNPWKVLNDKDCGWWIPLKQSALDQTLAIVLNSSEEDLKAKGQRGLELIKSDYAWPQVYKNIRASYDWLLGNVEKPDCIDVI